MSVGPCPASLGDSGASLKIIETLLSIYLWTTTPPTETPQRREQAQLIRRSASDVRPPSFI